MSTKLVHQSTFYSLAFRHAEFENNEVNGLRTDALASGAEFVMLASVLMNKIVNIAAYKFVALPELRSLRARLLALCKGWELKGTILLSAEGINLFVAGERGEN